MLVEVGWLIVDSSDASILQQAASAVAEVVSSQAVERAFAGFVPSHIVAR